MKNSKQLEQVNENNILLKLNNLKKKYFVHLSNKVFFDNAVNK